MASSKGRVPSGPFRTRQIGAEQKTTGDTTAMRREVSFGINRNVERLRTKMPTATSIRTETWTIGSGMTASEEPVKRQCHPHSLQPVGMRTRATSIPDGHLFVPSPPLQKVGNSQTPIKQVSTILYHPPFYDCRFHSHT